MKHDQLRGNLTKRIVQAGAHRVTVRDARAQLVQHAREQLESMGGTIATLESAVASGKGDILAQRRLRTLLTEHGRLETLIARNEVSSDQRSDASS